MKNAKLILSFGILAMIALGIWSCGEPIIPDDPKAKLPTLSINPPQSLAFDVAKGEVITFHIEANANADSKADLKIVKFEVNYSAGGDTSISWNVDPVDAQYKVINYDYTVPATVNEDDVITVSVSAEDKDGLIGTKAFVLTVKDLSGLSSVDGIILGAQNNPDIGSFYATSTKTIFKVADAQTSGQSTIDLIYFYGTSNTATIASPDNDNVFGNAAGKISSLLVQDWSTRNATRFRKVASMPTTEWDVLTSTRIAQIYATAAQPVEALANFLFDGTGGTQSSHVVFKTSKNKYGIFRVKDISSYDNTGAITIDVRVQK